MMRRNPILTVLLAGVVAVGSIAGLVGCGREARISKHKYVLLRMQNDVDCVVHDYNGDGTVDAITLPSRGAEYAYINENSKKLPGVLDEGMITSRTRVMDTIMLGNASRVLEHSKYLAELMQGDGVNSSGR